MVPTTFVPAAPLAHSTFTTSALTTARTAAPIHRYGARVMPRPAPVMVLSPERDTVDAPAEVKNTILLPEKLSAEGISLLSADFNVEKKLDLTPEQLLAEIENYEGIIIRSGTKMTREVIEAGKNLRVIGRAGVGVDNIDIPAATEKGVLVVNAPTGNCVAAAEHSIALMTSMARLISPADATIKANAWNRSSFVGASLVDKTLGVIGLGRIGREVSKRAIGLGMNVIASDPFTSEEAAAAIGVTLTSFDEVLANCDFLTMHIPLTPNTKNLIGTDELAKMKPSARLINAARGGIVNEEALLKALEEDKLAGAALDCFEFEPPHKYPDSISARLVQHEKVLATPHLGASTKEAQEDVAVEIAAAVRDALKGDMVATMINAPAMPPALLKTLKPRSTLGTALGRLAYFLSRASMKGGVKIDYNIPDASEDTRMLRAGVIKGLMEPALDIQVSIVNADNVAKKAGLNLTEVNHFTPSTTSEITISIQDTPIIEGRVTNGNPHVTRIGRFEVDLRLQGTILFFSQTDTPGQLGRIGTLLGENGINISFMTLGRCETSAKALSLYGLDSRPNDTIIKKINEIIDDDELRPIVIDF